MFLITLTYKQPLEIVDKYLSEHRAFIADCYKNNYFVLSGPKIPRTGGVIISPLKDRKQLENILKQDPFKANDVSDYAIIEFNPTKPHAKLSFLID